MFGRSKFAIRDQPLIVSVDEVVQDFCFRPFRDLDESGKLRVSVPAETFGDVRRAGPRRVFQLICEFVLVPKP